MTPPGKANMLPNESEEDLFRRRSREEGEIRISDEERMGRDMWNDSL